MKIIFLDVDGVLNSMSYYEKVDIEEAPLDMINVACLKAIVDHTGAKIVLTSTWRGGWEPDPELCQIQGQILNIYLNHQGLDIYDKTICINDIDGHVRCREIMQWIKDCPHKIEGMVIIDDWDFGWKDFGLADYWVKTDFMNAGLREQEADQAIQILQKETRWLKARNLLKKSTGA